LSAEPKKAALGICDMSEKQYDVIIIGAGMGGLTSALSLAAAGKKVLVLEKQPVPGGIATSFRRGGFIFDAVLHYVTGLASGGEIREFLDEHGVSQKIDFIEVKEFGKIIYPQHDFIAANDLDFFKAWMKTNFPQDAQGIEKFFGDAGRFYKHLDRFIESAMPEWLKLLLSPLLYPLVIKASCLTLEQFITKKIKDKRARSIIGTIWGFIGSTPEQISAFYFLIVLRGCWGEKTAFIRGGFSSLFKAMVERIRECGSEVRFNTTVKEISTEKNRRLRAVRTAAGEEFITRTVISNANAVDTLTKLIDDSLLRKAYAKKLSAMQKSLSAVQLYIGLNIDARELGMRYPLMYINATYDHGQNFGYCLSGDYLRCSLFVTSHSQLDLRLAPAGKSTLCAMTLDNYANWDNLTQEEYEIKKKEAAGIILGRLEKYLPGLSSHIEILEVASPKTMERFGSLPQGAVYGFSQIVGQSSLNRLSQETKIKGLFLAGAWTQPGCGMHGCLVSGKDAANAALKFFQK
jgi:phytoene desaturase